jgi:hypothetical protein
LAAGGYRRPPAMPIAPMPRLTGAPQVPAADLLELKRSVLQWCVDNPERLFAMLCTERGLDPKRVKFLAYLHNTGRISG